MDGGSDAGIGHKTFARTAPVAVMAGLVPAIRDFTRCHSKMWMPDTRPGMT